MVRCSRTRKHDGFEMLIGQAQAFEKVAGHLCPHNAVILAASGFPYIVHQQREIEEFLSRNFIVHAPEMLQAIGQSGRPREVIEMLHGD